MRLGADFHSLTRVTRDPFGLFKSSSSISNSTYYVDDALILTRQIAYNVIAPIIVSSGLLGNIMTIVLLRNPIFKGVMYNFFFALAVFDFLSLLFSVSAIMHLLHPMTDSYITAVWYSYLEVMIINGFMGTSVLIVVCITFDRFMSVCKPFTFKMLHTDYYCKVGILCSGIVSFLVWFPTCFLKRPTMVKDCDNFYLGYEFENSTLWVSCQILDPSEHDWYNIYAWIREIVISFLPIAIVIILNGLLVKYFVKKHKFNTNKASKDISISNVVKNSRQVADNNLLSLLKAIIISFLITILPAGIFNAAYSEHFSIGLKYEVFRATANNLELLNHALNFYLYILLSKPIRNALPSLIKDIKAKADKKLDFVLRKSDAKASSPDNNEVIERKGKENLSMRREMSKSASRQTQISDVASDDASKETKSIELQRSVSDKFDNTIEDSNHAIAICVSHLTTKDVTERTDSVK